jgi:GDP/UDP-N,N'-diacetylbacillosamine 2-epimerase (hydrolysing)
MLGNTSSGFIEASYFSKFVINLGNRQSGRLKTDNIFSVEISKKRILDAIEKYRTVDLKVASGVYGNGRAADSIIEIIKRDI